MSFEQTQPEDISRMTKFQKLAALLVMMGPEAAGQLLKTFEDHEVESISTEMAKLGLITQELQFELLHEFTEVALRAGTSLRGGRDFAQAALERALGGAKAATLLTRVSPASRPAAPGINQLLDLEPRQIFNLIKHEQPQAIALISSYLAPQKASEVLLMLRADLREQVIERLATLAPTSSEVVEKMVQVILQRMSGAESQPLNQTGGLKSAADLLNSLDRTMSKNLLLSLEERNPELGEAIRQKMFTFEDLRALPQSALQQIMREVDMRDLTVALKNASDPLKGKLLGCISKRAAETVREEMAFLGSVKAKDVEAAQMRMIEVVRRLEGEGEIDLSELEEPNAEPAMA